MYQERIQAVLVGTALGDTLGWPAKKLDRQAIKRRFGDPGIQAPPALSLYTDDTQLMVVLIDTLLAVGPLAPIEDQMDAFARALVQWKNTAPHRDPSPTVMKAILRLESGVRWDAAGLSRNCGGAVLSVVAMGILYHEDEARLRQMVTSVCGITHQNDAVLAATIASAYAVKLMLEDVPLSEFLRRIMLFCDGISEALDTALLRVGHVLGWGDEERALDHIGKGALAEEIVAQALYCVLRYADDFEACLRRAANTNGHSNLIAGLAGALMGARHGLEVMPDQWINRCENCDMLLETGSKISALFVAE